MNQWWSSSLDYQSLRTCSSRCWSLPIQSLSMFHACHKQPAVTSIYYSSVRLIHKRSFKKITRTFQSPSNAAPRGQTKSKSPWSKDLKITNQLRLPPLWGMLSPAGAPRGTRSPGTSAALQMVKNLLRQEIKNRITLAMTYLRMLRKIAACLAVASIMWTLSSHSTEITIMIKNLASSPIHQCP